MNVASQPPRRFVQRRILRQPSPSHCSANLPPLRSAEVRPGSATASAVEPDDKPDASGRSGPHNEALGGARAERFAPVDLPRRESR